MTKKSDLLMFFNRYTKEESVSLIKESVLDKVKLYAVEENKTLAFTCTLDSKMLGQKYYVISSDQNFKVDKKYSFCLKILSKVYFFKSQLIADRRGLYLADDIYIYEFKRRKHTRFEIPKDWRQGCVIFQKAKNAPKLSAQIIDFSWSGVRIELSSQLPDFKVNQEIQFSLQVHRRAEVLCHGIIKHVKKNKNTGAVLGILFTRTTKSFENKIENIGEDLVRYFILTQKNSHKDIL